jgi:WD40 repeat protein
MDYVKSLAIAASQGLLLSGSTDASIGIWSLGDASQAPKLLYTRRGHSRGIEDIAIDWSTSTKEQLAVYTASSDRTIGRWIVTELTATEEGEPLIIHETVVYSIKVDLDNFWTCIVSSDTAS